MHGANVQSTLIPDAIAIIASCTGSRSLMELAVALRAITTGKILLPSDRAETNLRIARDLMNRRWDLEAHVTLKDPRVNYFARQFCIACIQGVPAASANRDLAWQTKVQAMYAQDSSLRLLADLLVRHVRLRVTPALAVPVHSPIAPAETTSAASSSKHTKAELLAKAKTFAEQFIRRWETQKARATAIQAPVPFPEAASEPAQAPAPPAIAAPAPLPPTTDVMRVVVPWTRYTNVTSVAMAHLPAHQSTWPGAGDETWMPVFPAISPYRRFLNPRSLSPPA